MVIGKSEGKRVSKAKVFKGKYEAEVGWEDINRRTILGGGMDIFKKYLQLNAWNIAGLLIV